MIFVLFCSVILHLAQSPFYCQFVDQSKLSASSVTRPPLYITEHLNSGKSINEIQRLASVSLLNDSVTSYSGFFTVDKACKSNLFFWFFKSTEHPTHKPVVVWLQGGPGYTFLINVFGGNGPFILENGTLDLSNFTWTDDFNMLFIESPVGAGFSHTVSNNCYCSTVKQAADHLYESVQQYYRVFPEHKGSHVFLAGESYAAKYVSILASTIHHNNLQKNTTFVNLKGLFIGGGLIDPENQLYWADYLYDHRIVKYAGRKYVQYLESLARENIKKGNYYTAQFMLIWIAAYIYELGYWPPIDVRNKTLNATLENAMIKFIDSPHIRDAMHVGNLPFQNGNIVRWHFRNDFLKSVSYNLRETLQNYKVLLYSGEYDILIPPVQIDKVIEALDWSGLSKYQNKTKKSWYVDGEHAGYRKSYKHFSRVEVNDANHFILRSQPKWISELFKSFVKGKV